MTKNQITLYRKSVKRVLDGERIRRSRVLSGITRTEGLSEIDGALRALDAITNELLEAKDYTGFEQLDLFDV